MGFVRKVSLSCDGPCGSVAEGASKAPAGWHKLLLTRYMVLKDGEKPPDDAIRYGWFCPECTDKLVNLISTHGRFALSTGRAKETA